MKIAAVQMVSTPDVARNLEAAGRRVAEAAAAGARLVALPEYFGVLGRSDADKLALAEAPGDAHARPGLAGSADARRAAGAPATRGPMSRFLSEAARRHGIWLVGGTLPAAVPGRADRVRNACTVWAPDGSLAARYDKIHLFSFDDGRERYDEGRTLEAGSEAVAFDGEGLRVGLSVCYDLRFPELYRALMRPAPCDLVVVPSAFTHTTGRAHWELLLRARAVENQCWLLAPAQGGRHENGRRTWGHSMVVDPWGEVVAVRDEDGEGVVVADLDAARTAQVRRQLPALAHRKL